MATPRVKSSWPSLWLTLRITTGFGLLVPAVTLCLLKLKSFPTFPGSDWANALPWIYRALTFPSILAGLLVSGVAVLITRRTHLFHDPYDFGRAVSLGAVTGAFAQVAAVAAQHLWQYQQKLPHNFWLATAVMAGCLCGALIVALCLRHLARVEPWEMVPRPFVFTSVALGIAFTGALLMNYVLFAACIVSPIEERRVNAQNLVFHISTRPAILTRTLAFYLFSGDPARRFRAVYALAMVNQPSGLVMRALRRTTQDSDPVVREAAHAALARMQQDSPLPVRP